MTKDRRMNNSVKTFTFRAIHHYFSIWTQASQIEILIKNQLVSLSVNMIQFDYFQYSFQLNQTILAMIIRYKDSHTRTWYHWTFVLIKYNNFFPYIKHTILVTMAKESEQYGMVFVDWDSQFRRDNIRFGTIIPMNTYEEFSC